MTVVYFICHRIIIKRVNIKRYHRSFYIINNNNNNNNIMNQNEFKTI